MNIAILSRNPALYSTQSLVKAARRRHHFVRVIDYINCDLVVETNKVKVQYYGQEIKNIDAIIPRIGSSVTAYGSSVIKQFEAQQVFSTLTSESLYNARNKMTCLQMLASEGLGVPKTIMSNNYLAFSNLIEQIGTPTIIKLLKGTHGLGVLLAEKKMQAESLYETFFKMKKDAVLQEFIEEAGGADIRIFIVDQEIVGVMERKARPGDFRSNLHRGGTSQVVPITHEEAETAKKAVRVLGLHVAGVDMLRSKRGPLILEVNASPGLEGIETTTGVDIAGKIINFVERSVKNNG